MLAHTDTSALHDSARLVAPTLSLQLLKGCYKLMVTFQMSKAHTNDYTNKQAILQSDLFWATGVGGLGCATSHLEHSSEAAELGESSCVIMSLIQKIVINEFKGSIDSYKYGSLSLEAFKEASPTLSAEVTQKALIGHGRARDRMPWEKMM